MNRETTDNYPQTREGVGTHQQGRLCGEAEASLPVRES